MAVMNGAQALVGTLKANGIDTVFGPTSRPIRDYAAIERSIGGRCGFSICGRCGSPCARR